MRVIRACRDMGIATVAVYQRVRPAGAARAAWPTRRGRSARIRRARATCASTRSIDAARQSGADAVHPGYGFLAENEDFARACRDAGLTFIGPSPEAIELMGSKTAARQAAIAAGVPVVPGTETPLDATVPDAEVRAHRRAASAIR